MEILYVVGLRLVHILSAVLWAGGMAIMFFFVQPTARALGPAGIDFTRHMIGKAPYRVFMTWVVGSTAVRPRAGRIVAIGEEIAKGGGAPTPEQAASMQRAAQALASLGKVNLVLVFADMALMATARYWIW